MRSHVCGYALPFLLMLAPLGCSFSDSSESISHSISSPFESISASISSSSPGGAERAYREDVRDYTQTYVTSGGDFQAYQADLAKIAQRHGISNWEENMTTYVGMGEGLAKATVTDAQFMAYKRTLSGNDPKKMDAIQKGYDSAR